MKVGDILKSEINGIPGLQYPYKIIINEKCKYPYLQKLENALFLEKCNAFLNEFPSNKLLNKNRSFSQKKVINKNNNTIFSKKLFLKKNTYNYEKTSKQPIIMENLPLVSESLTPKSNIKSKSMNKKSQIILGGDLLIKNKIKNFKKGKKNRSLTFYRKNQKKTINSNCQEINHLVVDNFFNSNIIKNSKNNIINKTQKRHNIFEYRIKNKIKTINNIIEKLNTPIFIYNKTETN